MLLTEGRAWYDADCIGSVKSEQPSLTSESFAASRGLLHQGDRIELTHQPPRIGKPIPRSDNHGQASTCAIFLPLGPEEVLWDTNGLLTELKGETNVSITVAYWLIEIFDVVLAEEEVQRI